MYCEKGIGSGLTVMIYPDLRIKDLILENTQNCSNASLLLLLSGSADARGLPHF